MAKQRERDLTQEQAESLRRAVRGEIQRLCKHGGTGVAEILGVTQASISKFLAGKQGASLGLAVRVAYLLDTSLKELIGLSEPDFSSLPNDPKVRLAARAAILQGVTPRHIQSVTKAGATFEGGDPGADDWFHRFAEGYRDGEPSDTSAARSAIKGRRRKLKP